MSPHDQPSCNEARDDTREETHADRDDPDSDEGEVSERLGPFVERFALDMAEDGFPRMSARVLGALLVAPAGALSAAELARTLAVSPAAVSGAVRHLGAVGLVTRERVPGSRRDRYRLLDDVWYESFVRAGDRFQRWADTLQLALEHVDRDSEPGRRLAEARGFFLFLREQFPALMAAWRAQEAGPPS